MSARWLVVFLLTFSRHERRREEWTRDDVKRRKHGGDTVFGFGIAVQRSGAILKANRRRRFRSVSVYCVKCWERSRNSRGGGFEENLNRNKRLEPCSAHGISTYGVFQTQLTCSVSFKGNKSYPDCTWGPCQRSAYSRRRCLSSGRRQEVIRCSIPKSYNLNEIYC